MQSHIVSKFKGKGFKLTPQRLAVLEFLDGNTCHPSAEEIFRATRQRHPMISFATVYNTLEMLSKNGDIMEVSVDATRRRYDPNTAPHHHAVCTTCGKIIDVPESLVGLSAARLNIPDYTVSQWHIDFRGICKDCEKEGR